MAGSLPDRTHECRRTPWSAAAAVCSLALAAVQVDLVARGSERGAYLVVVLVAGAVASGLAALGMALRNCAVSRTTAVVVAAATLLGVTLLVTVGLPGAAPVPLAHQAVVAFLLAAALPTLVGLDATYRPRPGPAGGAVGAVPILSDDAHPGPARGGRPRHRTHPRPGAGA